MQTYKIQREKRERDQISEVDRCIAIPSGIQKDY